MRSSATLSKFNKLRIVTIQLLATMLSIIFSADDFLSLRCQKCRYNSDHPFPACLRLRCELGHVSDINDTFAQP